MDIMVLNTQLWLNKTYTGKNGYKPIDIDEYGGNTGWTTIYALTRALQIEMGISVPADNFGTGTTAKFNSLYPSGVRQQASNETKTNNVYGIIQGALWCKGYSTGASEITTNFYGGTGDAIRSLKADAGFTNPDSTVTLEVMKALLSMKQYVKIGYLGGTDKIRTIQQYFNRNYLPYVGLAPCDGIYTREMNEALIKVLQAIEGYAVEAATGYFGDGTKSKLPLLPSSNNGNAIYLLRAALCCNGYDVDVSTAWGGDVESKLKEFQQDICLPETGTANTNTWMALLISRGNPDRSSNGCDTRFEITASRLATLKSNGYQVVGRYLTGGSFKELREGEIERILAGGMKMFPIFQESGTELSYFTPQRARKDSVSASRAARKYGIPKNSIIYFAVDTDPQDYEIKNIILPYFQALAESFDPEYKIGVYGTRNVCTQVCSHSYAITSFVADMSYGFSGNMGFKIPKNWNFDQYYEIKTSESGWDFDLDKTTYSGQFPVVDHVEYRKYIQPEIPAVPAGTPSILSFIEDIRELETMYVQYYEKSKDPLAGFVPLTPNDVAKAMTNFLRSQEYNNWEWILTTGQSIDHEFLMSVMVGKPALWNRIYDYIKGNHRALLSDGKTGLIDLSHMAATLEAYLSSLAVPNFWAGWGGDLATGMEDTTFNYTRRNEPGHEMYAGKTLQEIADATIGKDNLRCNYSDFCSDFDAYKISSLFEGRSVPSNNLHLFSDILEQYYTSFYENRFQWIAEELNSNISLGNLQIAIKNKMDIKAIGFVQVTDLKGGKPTEEVYTACCSSFANYIYTMIS